ncbi:MAG: biotin--[acetyl-CoA-carboxylase] ligase [Xanthomonadales bacterium]|nr:biotin--[acetyl-CoA-carboxylase] ligase [Xanthomonadales bacterium]
MLLDPAAIQSALPPAVRGRIGALCVLAAVDSTNSELQRIAARDGRDILVCLAERQHLGRGRRGRGWIQPPGGGIALSVLKRFGTPLAHLAGLSLAAGVAVARALEGCGVPPLGLKWPNDLVHDSRKLGGILVELGGAADGPCHAIIGVGVNCELGPAADRIGQPCTDLAALGARPPHNLLAARMLEELLRMFERFAIDGFAAAAEEFARRDVLAGRELLVSQDATSRAGIGRGVDARGALRVGFADGEAVLDAAEVSVRVGA